MGSRDEADRSAYACARHGRQGIGQKRMPVSHPDVDPQRPTGGVEARLKPGGLPMCELGDRRAATGQLVVVGNLLDPFRGDASSTQHVGQEGSDVVWPLRAAERHDQHGIERTGRGHVTSPLHRLPDRVVVKRVYSGGSSAERRGG